MDDLQRKAEEVKPYLYGRSIYLVGQFLLFCHMVSSKILITCLLI